MPKLLPGQGKISIHALLTESDGGILDIHTPPIDFNPRSPHGERRLRHRFCDGTLRFQSTLSSRRATNRLAVPFIHGLISIHALLTESDSQRFCQGKAILKDFNPRSPHGERRGTRGRSYDTKGFQSTLSSRRATGATGRWRSSRLFQSTLSSRRATPVSPLSPWIPWDFNPRSPHGERHLPQKINSDL